MISIASDLENGGRLSLSNDISSAILLPIISGRVEISCPNLINEGPSSSNAFAILVPSDEFDLSFNELTPKDIISVKTRNKNLNLTDLMMSFKISYFLNTLTIFIKKTKLLIIRFFSSQNGLLLHH